LAIGAAPLLMLAHVRLIRPLRLRRRPWRVAEVRREAARIWTLALEPEGHEGFAFLPGQFVWLTLGESPLAIRQHPFSISSSAENPRRIDLTIKELGDFTSTIGTVPTG